MQKQSSPQFFQEDVDDLVQNSEFKSLPPLPQAAQQQIQPNLSQFKPPNQPQNSPDTDNKVQILTQLQYQEQTISDLSFPPENPILQDPLQKISQALEQQLKQFTEDSQILRNRITQVKGSSQKLGKNLFNLRQNQQSKDFEHQKNWLLKFNFLSISMRKNKNSVDSLKRKKIRQLTKNIFKGQGQTMNQLEKIFSRLNNLIEINQMAIQDTKFDFDQATRVAQEQSIQNSKTYKQPLNNVKYKYKGKWQFFKPQQFINILKSKELRRIQQKRDKIVFSFEQFHNKKDTFTTNCFDQFNADIKLGFQQQNIRTDTNLSTTITQYDSYQNFQISALRNMSLNSSQIPYKQQFVQFHSFEQILKKGQDSVKKEQTYYSERQDMCDDQIFNHNLGRKSFKFNKDQADKLKYDPQKRKFYLYSTMPMLKRFWSQFGHMMPIKLVDLQTYQAYWEQLLLKQIDSADKKQNNGWVNSQMQRDNDQFDQLNLDLGKNSSLQANSSFKMKYPIKKLNLDQISRKAAKQEIDAKKQNIRLSDEIKLKTEENFTFRNQQSPTKQTLPTSPPQFILQSTPKQNSTSPFSPSTSPLIDKKEQLDPINPKLESPNFKDDQQQIIQDNNLIENKQNDQSSKAPLLELSQIKQQNESWTQSPIKEQIEQPSPVKDKNLIETHQQKVQDKNYTKDSYKEKKVSPFIMSKNSKELEKKASNSEFAGNTEQKDKKTSLFKTKTQPSSSSIFSGQKKGSNFIVTDKNSSHLAENKGGFMNFSSQSSPLSKPDPKLQNKQFSLKVDQSAWSTKGFSTGSSGTNLFQKQEIATNQPWMMVTKNSFFKSSTQPNNFMKQSQEVDYLMVDKENGAENNQSGNSFMSGHVTQYQTQTQNNFMSGFTGENQAQSKNIFGSQINYQSGSFNKVRK